MNITIVQGAFFPVPPLRGGAVEKVWFELGKRFAAEGHEVTHVSRLYGDLPREEMIEGVRHVRVAGFEAPRSLLRLKLCDLIYSLRVLGRLPRADILVTHTFWLPMLVRSASRGKLYVHVARYPKGQLRFYGRAARLQTVSHEVEQAIRREIPPWSEKVRCIPYPVPQQIEKSAGELARRRSERRLLYVGRVHPEKGIQLLLAAVALIPAEIFAGWKLEVVGPFAAREGGGGEAYLSDLQRLSERMADRVDWVGPVFDPQRLDDYYRRASLFVYPSLAERGETFGLAPLEAMSHGCATVVSNLACFRDFIEPEGTGFVFDHRAAEPARALADMLSVLMENPELMERVAQEGYLRTRMFSMERVTEQYLADFRSLLPEV